MNFIERLEMLYESGDVKRCHTMRVLHEQTVGQHVYGSLLIAVELCEHNGLSAEETLNVLATLLYHDAPERHTGDTPAPVKRRSTEVKQALDRMEDEFSFDVGYGQPRLSKKQVDIVKACDTLDLMWKCVNELRLGNRNRMVCTMMKNVNDYINAQMHVKGVEKIVPYLLSQWAILKGGALL